VRAEAGIRRLGLTPAAMQVLEDEVMIPAPGQGALGLQIREDDHELAALLQHLNDVNTAACCLAERTLLDKLGGGCQVPLGAHATVLPDNHLRLRGRVISLDGRTVINCGVIGALTDPAALGEEAAEVLRSNGAAAVIDAARKATVAIPESEAAPDDAHANRRVIVTRDEDADGPLSRELRALGIDPVCIPLIRTRILRPAEELEAACAAGLDWVVLSSAVAVQALAASSEAVHTAIRRARVACVGSATADALRRELDVIAHVIGDNGRDELLAQLKPLVASPANRVLVAKGNLAPLTVEETLRAAGCDVKAVVVYETTVRKDRAALLRQLLTDGGCHAITFCSSSAVDAFVRLVPSAATLLAGNATRVVSIGDSTSESLRGHGLPVHAQPSTPTFPELAATVATALDAKPTS
jgi:uroporphyrinogen-III synthase